MQNQVWVNILADVVLDARQGSYPLLGHAALIGPTLNDPASACTPACT
jgi:hypothetical protein